MSQLINNTAELKEFLRQKLSRGMLEYLSKKIVKIMQDNLENSDISTRTLQKSVDFTIGKDNMESIISINYEFAQSFAEPPIIDGGGLVEWGHLTNTFGDQAGEQTWNGELVSFKLAQWLEYGGNGDIGNQPIPASQWFSKTVSEVKTNIHSWAQEYFAQIGVL